MGQDLVHPYIQSTTVLCDYSTFVLFKPMDSNTNEIVIVYKRRIMVGCSENVIMTISPILYGTLLASEYTITFPLFLSWWIEIQIN